MKLVRVSLHGAFLLLLLFGFTAPAWAAAKSGSTSGTGSGSSGATQSSATGVQPYTSASPLQIGTIVELAGGKTDSVNIASAKNMQNMYGAVIDPNTLPLTVTNSSITNETYVANSGRYEVLVDTQNGEIAEGDYVTISAVDGVAMKAGSYDDQHYVFGRAAAAFTGKSNVIDTTTVKYSDGKSQTVQIGVIPVSINVQQNPNVKSTKVNLPPFLQQLGQAVAQKPVGPTRIYLSIVITGLSIIVALVTLYAGVRNAIVAIGRNPLSKKSIFRGLLEVILTGFLILIIGLFAVYLLLKL